MLAAFVFVAASRRAPETPAQPERFAAADHPVAVLAWAQLHCNPALALRADAHRTHTEILLRVAAAYDQARSWRSLDDVCRDAIAAARPAIAPDMLPKAGTVVVSISAQTAANAP